MRKPHYRKIRAADVTPGMRIYSILLRESFTVESVLNEYNRVILKEGCFTLRAPKENMLWLEARK